MHGNGRYFARLLLSAHLLITVFVVQADEHDHLVYLCHTPLFVHILVWQQWRSGAVDEHCRSVSQSSRNVYLLLIAILSWPENNHQSLSWNVRRSTTRCRTWLFWIGHSIQKFVLLETMPNNNIFIGNIEKVEYCSIELNEDQYKAFVYAVRSNYWYQMYIDELPIWGMLMNDGA
jgi:hypothetical protein